MKKIFSMLTLFIVMGTITPVLASPHGLHNGMMGGPNHPPIAKGHIAPMPPNMRHAHPGFNTPHHFIGMHRPKYYVGYPRHIYWDYPHNYYYGVNCYRNYYPGYTGVYYSNNGLYLNFGVPLF